MRQQHTDPDGQGVGNLPPLLYAGLILEGGIIGYDTNVLTGGAGVRYFRRRRLGQFRMDQVTVYLRAVSTQSGQVLKPLPRRPSASSPRSSTAAYSATLTRGGCWRPNSATAITSPR